MISIFILSVLSLFNPVLYLSGPISSLASSIPAPVVLAIVYPLILFVVDHLKLEVDPSVEALPVAQSTIRLLLHKAQANATRLLAAEDALKDAEQNIAKLKAQNSICEYSNHSLLRRCSEQDSTLAAIIDERNSSVATWTQDNAHLQERTAELESLYIFAHQAKSSLESQNAALLTQLGEVQSGISALAQENARLLEDNHNIKELLDNVIQRRFISERENQVLQGDVKDLRFENAVLVKEKEEVLEKLSVVEGRSVAKDVESKGIKTRTQTTTEDDEAHYRTIANKDAEIKSLCARVQDTDKDNESLRHNIKSLELTISDKDATIKALSTPAVTDGQVELQLKNTYAMLNDLLASAASVDSDVYPPMFADSDSDSDESPTTPSLSAASASSSDIDVDDDDDRFFCTPFPPRRTPSTSGCRFGSQSRKHDLHWTVLITEAIRVDEAINGCAQLEEEEP